MQREGGRMYLLQLSQSTTRAAAALTFTSTLTKPKTGLSSIDQWECSIFPDWPIRRRHLEIIPICDSYSRSFNFYLNFDSTGGLM